MEDKKCIPLVSICSITYNHALYIRQCLEGFLMQKTNFAFEVIINDDCSTDGTTEILKEYAEKYPHIIKPIFQQENQYQKGVRGMFQNIVLPRAHGKFIAICEGDDYWTDPLKLQKQVDFFQKNSGMTYCFTNRYEDDEIKHTRDVVCYHDRRYTLKDFISGFNPGIQTAMFLKEAYEQYYNPEYSLKVNGDRILPYFCLQNGYAKCLQEITGVYRKTGAGVCTSLAKTMGNEEWFVHSTNDFYNYHKTIGYPDVSAYVRGMTPRVSAYLKSVRNFSFRVAYKQVGRYRHNNDKFVFLLVISATFKYIFEKVLNKCYSKTASAWTWFARKFKSSHFSSYVFELNQENLNELSKMKEVLALQTPSLNLTNAPTTIADAFLYSDERKMWMFYELQEHLNSKGLLMGVFTEDGVNWSQPKLILEETCHLSFPFVFGDNESVYMIPETSMMNEIRLYKGTKDCDKFTFVKTLFSGERYVDTCVYKKDGVYYLFTSVQFSDNSYSLHLYVSNNLMGEWKEHPSSPISEGKSHQRNAGAILNVDGMLIRPAQENRKHYAQNTHLFKITELSPESYIEEPMWLDVVPIGWKKSIGGHQYSMCSFKGKTYVAIDVLQRSFNLKSFLKLFFKK